jgi:hypothetical protein
MASKEEQVMGLVRTQDLSVSWISESGIRDENYDRVCILTMANGQVRLTMQSATMNLKGMRLTKGHVCVFALFEACEPGKGEVADKASEMFMNMIMKYDITKKPATDVMKKCLSKVNKVITKEFKDSGYKASVAAFAGKELTICSVNNGTLYFVSGDGKLNEFKAADIGIFYAGAAWKDVMIVSDGYPVVINEIKDDMRSPIGDLITKRDMRSLDDSASLIRAQRL